MTLQPRIAAVTGANKGIGLAIVRNLALKYRSSPLNSGPLTIYLTARSSERGEEAVKILNADRMLKQSKVLVQDGGDTTIKFRALDISDETSIHAFRDFVKETHTEGIDVLINNAGIALTGFDAKVAKDTIHTNYYGTLTMTRDFLPLLRSGGRIVNVASESGKLNKYSSTLQESFINASEASVEACSALMESFISGVKAGRHEEEGWPSAAYAASKAGEIAMTKAIAMEESKNARRILVNACCPGWVDTDMTKGKGTKTPDEGAKTPVMLALDDVGGVTGQFWQNENVVNW